MQLACNCNITNITVPFTEVHGLEGAGVGVIVKDAVFPWLPVDTPDYINQRLPTPNATSQAAYNF